MKYCHEQGCKQLVTKGRYCEDHKRKKKNKWQSNNKSFYNSQPWKDLKSFCYQRDKGRCLRCEKFVFGKQAQHHHIVPIRVNPKLKLDPDNIRTLCSKCHPIEEDEANVTHGIRDKSKFVWKI